VHACVSNAIRNVWRVEYDASEPATRTLASHEHVLVAGKVGKFLPASLAMVEHRVSGHFPFAGLLEDYIMRDAARFTPLACRH
jgi:hypothetical protein